MRTNVYNLNQIAFGLHQSSVLCVQCVCSQYFQTLRGLNSPGISFGPSRERWHVLYELRKPVKAKEHNTIVFAFPPLPTLGQIRPLYSQFSEPSSTTPAWADARPRVNEELLSVFDVEHHGRSVPRLRHLQTSHQVCVTHRLQTSRNRGAADHGITCFYSGQSQLITLSRYRGQVINKSDMINS